MIGRIRNFLRVNLIAGVFIAIPAACAVFVLVYVWGKLGEPLYSYFGVETPREGVWTTIVRYLQEGSYERLLDFIAPRMLVPMLSLFMMLLVLVLFGILLRSFIGRFLLSPLESMVARVPLVGVIYTSVKQLIEAFITPDGRSNFKTAVLVQFPMKGSWVIGFVTGNAYSPLAHAVASTLPQSPQAELLTVFVPTTPLPTQGFTLVLPKTETLELDIGIPEAIKLVVSGGIINSDRTKSVSPVKNHPENTPELLPNATNETIKA